MSRPTLPAAGGICLSLSEGNVRPKAGQGFFDLDLERRPNERPFAHHDGALFLAALAVDHANGGAAVFEAGRCPADLAGHHRGANHDYLAGHIDIKQDPLAQGSLMARGRRARRADGLALTDTGAGTGADKGSEARKDGARLAVGGVLDLADVEEDRSGGDLEAKHYWSNLKVSVTREVNCRLSLRSAVAHNGSLRIMAQRQGGSVNSIPRHRPTISSTSCLSRSTSAGSVLATFFKMPTSIS